MGQTVVGVHMAVGVGSVAVGVWVVSSKPIGVGVSGIVRVPRVGLGISLSISLSGRSSSDKSVGESGENAVSAGDKSTLIVLTAGSSGVDERVVVSQRKVSVGEGSD